MLDIECKEIKPDYINAVKCGYEYIWLGGYSDTDIRFKTRYLPRDHRPVPNWGFDGSSTKQAVGSDSDCVLAPVLVLKDSAMASRYLVLSEVLECWPDGNLRPHSTNHRRDLVDLCSLPQVRESAPLFGMEQEFVFMDCNARPLGFPERGFPAPQGEYYCKQFNDILDMAVNQGLLCGLNIYGTNSEVLLGQFEFQVGPCPPVEIADQLTVARYLLQRAAAKYGLTVSFDPKPVMGDWNGSGCHVNMSTAKTRSAEFGQGRLAIDKAINRLSGRHNNHIAVYGEGNEARLTGHHETCPITEFRSGVADRGASIRVPLQVDLDGFGYFEDRRPAANCDPYRVVDRLIRTVIL